MKIYMVLKKGGFKMSAKTSHIEAADYLSNSFGLERVSFFEYMTYKLFKRG